MFPKIIETFPCFGEKLDKTGVLEEGGRGMGSRGVLFMDLLDNFHINFNVNRQIQCQSQITLVTLMTPLLPPAVLLVPAANI